jgi:dienelactone hydrolase
MILDLYRGLAILAANPAIDPNRIAVMGFSRGGQAALYATLKRFQKMWNPSGIDAAAYIALYPPCITTYIDDTQVSDHPIRIFHGISDDWVEIAPCRAYFERLRATRPRTSKSPNILIRGTRLIIPRSHLNPSAYRMHRRRIAC